MADSISRILLVRHGPSSHVHDGQWLPHDRVSTYEDAYDAAGIRRDAPPSDLVTTASAVDVIAASDMQRAIESARRLAPGRVPAISPLLRELRLEPPSWVPIELPIEVWDMMSFVQWSWRLLTDADDATVRRAKDASAWIEAQLRESRGSTALVVTHGGFRRILAAQLVLRGWRDGTERRSHANWSVWQLSKETGQR